MVTNLGLSLLGALLGNAGGASAANIAARYVASGAFLTFSRDDEREADRVGVGIMARAGWDPHGMIELMETIREQEKRDPGSVEMFFSNHPSSKDRVALLERVVPARRSGTRDSAGFQSIRARLRKLTPAKSMSKKITAEFAKDAECDFRLCVVRTFRSAVSGRPAGLHYTVMKIALSVYFRERADDGLAEHGDVVRLA